MINNMLFSLSIILNLIVVILVAYSYSNTRKICALNERAKELRKEIEALQKGFKL